MTEKATLRATIRERLRALHEEERRERSLAICQQITTLPCWSEIGCVAAFSALPDEPDLSPLLDRCAPRRLAFPRIEGEHLVFLEVASRSDLSLSRWNLLEPVYREEAVIPVGEIDLLLVPGVAFTRDGHRMGRGRGYYDRLMAHPEFRAKTVGVCFREQVVPELPLEPHDLSVTSLIEA